MDTKNRRILKIRKSFSFKKIKNKKLQHFLMVRSETGGVRMLTPSKGSSPTPVFLSYYFFLLFFSTSKNQIMLCVAESFLAF